MIVVAGGGGAATTVVIPDRKHFLAPFPQGAVCVPVQAFFSSA